MTDREQYAPGPAYGAQIKKDGVDKDKWTLILIRELRHAPEKVWQALTDPAHLREWAPFEVDGSLGTVGTTVKLTWVGTPPLFGLSSFLYLLFRDFGCGKAMSFDDVFRKDRLNKTLQRRGSCHTGGIHIC